MVIAFFIVDFKTHSVNGIFLKTEKVANQGDMAMRCGVICGRRFLHMRRDLSRRKIDAPGTSREMEWNSSVEM